MSIKLLTNDIHKDYLIKTYEELSNKKCFDSLKYELIGNKILDYFFLSYRLAAKTKKQISFKEALKNESLSKTLLLKGRQLENKKGIQLNPTEKIKLKYTAFRLYFGTINQFRPIIAREIYCIFEPKIGILDFSAGWGGRCLAAMSLQIPYIGIDANKKLKKPYQKMIETLDPDANVSMIFKPAEKVDFSKYKYDLVFTSPPYYMLEKYENMPSYHSKQDFMNRFFIPVISNVWKYLAQNGFIVLNMPVEMKEDIKNIIPEPIRTFYLPIRDRHPTLEKTFQERTEPIFIFHKGNGSISSIDKKWKKLKNKWN